MSGKRQRICPICGEAVPPLRDNRAFPFCSPRCKRVDLGKWLAEDYAVSAEPSDPSVIDFTRPVPQSDDWS